MLTWQTTVIKTRVLYNDNDTRIGHVRNIGRKQWYAEDYLNKDYEVFQTLNEAKSWLENIQDGD